MTNAIIASLDDDTAIGIAGVIAKSLMRGGNIETSPTPEMAAALESALPVAVAGAADRASEGEIARAALQWLAEDPEYAKRISAMILGANTQRFSVDPATIGMVVAGIVILQTRIRFEKDKKGQTSFVIEKKAASDTLLKALVEKLMGWMNPKKQG